MIYVSMQRGLPDKGPLPFWPAALYNCGACRSLFGTQVFALSRLAHIAVYRQRGFCIYVAGVGITGDVSR